LLEELEELILGLLAHRREQVDVELATDHRRHGEHVRRTLTDTAEMATTAERAPR
jgi:hypothetical protein